MKKNIFILFCSLVVNSLSAQWTPTVFEGKPIRKSSAEQHYYKLDINKIRLQLKDAQETGKNAKPVEISLPTMAGKIERFAVYSFPVAVKELAEQYQLGSYVGVGIEDPSKYVRFSVAPNDFQSMIVKDGIYEFIEPANIEKTVYGVHSKTVIDNKGNSLCSMNESILSKKQLDNLYKQGKIFNKNVANFSKSSDKKFRTLRLAMSVTGEYTQFHGGTVAGALTAMNATLTRINGIFEKDFAVHLNLQNFPGIIYTTAATDPYSAGTTGVSPDWNLELQQTLTANVGNFNYDIGHLLAVATTGGGGNAGCLSCVCIDPSTVEPLGKGSGYTAPIDGIPQGDNFDTRIVAHELGHQLGANHTFSANPESFGVNVEPGSGSTIMSYAGITGPDTDVQSISDPYFHNVSIRQVQTNLINKTCDIETAITNSPPVITALTPYTIPKGTAFVLTASATDAENDPMTYTWEEVDNASVIINKNNLGTTASGATFRSVLPTTNPTRYFPKLSSVVNGILNNSGNTWESVSMVPRTTKFAVTVRDNNPVANQQQTQFAEQTIVVGNDGPFKINTQFVTFNVPSIIEWDVANTVAIPYNVGNVKIDYSTDNGLTWTILSSSTPNDGAENFTFPASLNGQTIKLRISAIGNVFYVVNPISVTTFAVCDGTAPTGITISNINMSSANVNWMPISGATYVIRYKKISETTWQQTTTSSTITILSGLTDATAYEVQIAAVCSGTLGSYSASSNFTTMALTYCVLTSSNASDEYISNVTVANLNNTSGSSTYTDYTTDLTKVVNLILGSTNNTISVAKTWPADLYDDGVRVWIDFDRNGTFDTSEMVMDSPPNKVTPVSASFTVPTTAVLNKSLRMRVALRYDESPESCISYDDGEVEDYNVRITDVLGVNDIANPKDGIQIYPNPVGDVLNITNVSDKTTYKIYSIAGQLVNSGNINGEKINVASLVKGTYVITIEDKTISKNMKFIKK